jgi:hypothetical protein
LDRFENQVVRLGPGTLGGARRAVMVIMPGGVMRTALAQEETISDNDLKGEWKGAPERTGKWSFVQWIDDDMSSMAVARTTADVPMGEMFKSPFDASFWSIESLPRLQLESAVPSKRAASQSPLHDEGSHE